MKRTAQDNHLFIHGLGSSVRDWDVTAQLNSIQCPSLIIAADQDYSPVAVKEAYIKLMPNF